MLKAAPFLSLSRASLEKPFLCSFLVLAPSLEGQKSRTGIGGAQGGDKH